MNLKINKLPDHSMRVIVVPEEKVLSPVSDIDIITYGDDSYMILEHITVNKNNPIPSVLKLLSAGLNISDEKIWKGYNKSEKIYFFLVKKIMTKEDRVQHDFVMWFSENWPECEGMIFECYNNSKTQQEGQYRRAMGRKAGVADACGFTPLGKFLGIEIKAPGSSHKIIQLQTELRWGRKVIENGGFYLITEDIEAMKYFIEKLWSNESEKAIELMHRCIEDVEKRINETKYKSIMF